MWSASKVIILEMRETVDLLAKKRTNIGSQESERAGLKTALSLSSLRIGD